MIRSLFISLTLILFVSSCGMNKIRYGKKVKAEPSVEQIDVSYSEQFAQQPKIQLNQTRKKVVEVNESIDLQPEIESGQVEKKSSLIEEKDAIEISHPNNVPSEPDPEEVEEVRNTGLGTWILGGLMIVGAITIIILKLAGVFVSSTFLPVLIILGGTGLLLLIVGLNVYLNPQAEIKRKAVRAEEKNIMFPEENDEIPRSSWRKALIVIALLIPFAIIIGVAIYASNWTIGPF